MNTKPRDPNKRQRKTVKHEYPPVRIMSPTGKLRLASEMAKERRKRETYKSVLDASFWADYEPDRRFGTFANTSAGTYTHNGITKYL